jgi:hypothetical protein
MAKRIILLSDGTGNAAASIWRTNVWRMFQAIDQSQGDQFAFYNDGIGTSPFKVFALLAGVFGYGLKRNVIASYKSLCRNYCLRGHAEEVEIFAFGFSRGAFTIRVLIGLLMSQGIVGYSGDEAKLDRLSRAAYRAYRRENRKSFPVFELIASFLASIVSRSRYDGALNLPPPTIKFIGVWDTVAAYGLPAAELTQLFSRWIWSLRLANTSLDPRVERACHALSLDDERTTFHPLLWTERGETGERITQVWFSGVHSNVGGGYPDDSLAYVPLVWIMEQAAGCGLRFKGPPSSELNVVGQSNSLRSTYGRLYDSRGGLASYYRYGPRRIASLCEFEKDDPADGVLIAVPKIHHTVFDRIRDGVVPYAPIGIPSNYAVVTESGQVLQGAANPYETPEQATVRAARQELVWNKVRWRRAAYFGNVSALMGLILLPLFLAVRPSVVASPIPVEINATGQIALDNIEAIRPPSFWEHLVGAYTTSPLIVGALGSLLLLCWIANRKIQSSILEAMATAWRGSRYGDLGPPKLSVLQKLQTKFVYGRLASALRSTIGPSIATAVVLYVTIVACNRVVFDLLDGAGAYCLPSAQTRSLAVGQSVVLAFNTANFCSSTGLLFERGSRYFVTLTGDAGWRDGGIETNAKGYRESDFSSWSRRGLTTLVLPFRRTILRPWFSVIAQVGVSGSYQLYLYDFGENRTGASVRPDKDGELFLYVNDAVLAIPGLVDLFYRNNSGEGRLTIRRVD